MLLLMSQLSLEDICLSFCHDTALEILALRQQGGGFLPCLMTKILRIYSSRFNWYINNNANMGEYMSPIMILLLTALAAVFVLLIILFIQRRRDMLFMAQNRHTVSGTVIDIT